MNNRNYSEIIAAADCADIAVHYGANLHKISGGKYWGTCPACVRHGREWGTDKFEVYPDKVTGISRWSCRGCGITCGDALNLIRAITDCDAQTGIRMLSEINGTPVFSGEHNNPPVRNAAAVKKDSCPPSVEWQHALNDIVFEAVFDLWESPEAAAARQYLLSVRKLSENELRTARFGYNPRKKKIKISSMPDEVTVHPGILIPSYTKISRLDSQLFKVNCRTEEQQDFKPSAKYMMIHGSLGVSLFQSGKALETPNVIFCEGEIDAVSINGLGLSDIKAVTFGSSANIGSAGKWKRFYSSPEKIAICFDSDAAGQDGAEKLREQIIRVSKREPLIKRLPDGYKDFNEVLVKGGSEKLKSIVKTMFQ